jgi:polyhydroxyalkanoate synthesis regulator phasin
MPDREKPAVATATVPVPAPAPVAGGVATAIPPVPPKRSPGHRGADVKDTVAEMAAKAHEISLEAGSKMAAAMKDVIGAAAGLTGLVLESARDLLQYMVRRGQMTQDEADKLMREVEASHGKRKPAAAPPSPAPKAAARVEPTHAPHAGHAPHTGHAAHAAPPKHVAAPAKHPVKHAAPAKKPTAKKPTMKPAAKKPVKVAAKAKPKASAKSAKKR